MAHPHIDHVRKAHGDRLEAMTGRRGEHPSERAERLASADDAGTLDNISMTRKPKDD